MEPLVGIVRYCWALPNTLLGVLLTVLECMCLGRWRVVSGVIEVHGPFSRFLLSRAVPLAGGAMAITFGHVVLGISQQALDLTREHERVHVRQYERWGPFFLPAYFLSSLVVWMRGGQAYRDNRFEEQARREAG